MVLNGKIMPFFSPLFSYADSIRCATVQRFIRLLATTRLHLPRARVQLYK